LNSFFKIDGCINCIEGLITGKIISYGFPAWIGDIEYKWWKFDLHPAKEPYDI